MLKLPFSDILSAWFKMDVSKRAYSKDMQKLELALAIKRGMCGECYNTTVLLHQINRGLFYCWAEARCICIKQKKRFPIISPRRFLLYLISILHDNFAKDPLCI